MQNFPLTLELEKSAKWKTKSLDLHSYIDFVLQIFVFTKEGI